LKLKGQCNESCVVLGKSTILYPVEVVRYQREYDGWQTFWNQNSRHIILLIVEGIKVN